MKPPSIFIKNATLSYEKHCLFEKLNLALPAGQCLCLLGPSGVGKSSLLRYLANLSIPPNTTLQGKISCSDSLPLKNRLAFMAQTDALLPWLTVSKNITLGANLRKEKIDKTKLANLLDAVELTQAKQQLPAQLSGGMRQRAALARTLYEDKPIIVMDEPFNALDIITKRNLQDLSLHLLTGRTTLLVTHDPIEALRLADKIYVMSGKPAKLTEMTQLKPCKAKAADDPNLLSQQAILMTELYKAKETLNETA